MSTRLVRWSETEMQDCLPGQQLARTGALRETIGTRAARLCFEKYGRSLRAVVLTGSLARHEATVVEDSMNWRLLGDAEFLLFFHSGAPLPPKVATDLLCRNIEALISLLRISAKICLNATHSTYLQRLRPSIFAYELRNCGQVVGGDPGILDLIPGFCVSDIPFEDGWRLLSNRMVEQLEALAEAEKTPKNPMESALYTTLKLYLDMATSLLLFVGEYAPSYWERERRLRKLADTRRENRHFPFDIGLFCDRVSECTRWKLSQTGFNSSYLPEWLNGRGPAWWEEAITYAQRLWRWELTLLTETTGSVSNEVLLQKWMKCQPLSRRLRGWAYVVRDQGWHGAKKNWQRWAHLARRGSPRYLVYEAASEALFQLPFCLWGAGTTKRMDGPLSKVTSCLPVSLARERGPALPEWVRLAKDIAWNYKRFLVGTES